MADIEIKIYHVSIKHINLRLEENDAYCRGYYFKNTSATSNINTARLEISGNNITL